MVNHTAVDILAHTQSQVTYTSDVITNSSLSNITYDDVILRSRSASGLEVGGQSSHSLYYSNGKSI